MIYNLYNLFKTLILELILLTTEIIRQSEEKCSEHGKSPKSNAFLASKAGKEYASRTVP